MINNKTLVVMCNGPSLREVDFNDLDGYDTFGMNLAYRYYYEHNWWPTYFGCFDKLYNEEFKDEFQTMVDSDIPVKSFFLLSDKYSRSADARLVNVKINGDLYSFSNMFGDFGNGGNTGVNCCQVGICLGYKKIILLGADCNFVEDLGNKEDGDSCLTITSPIDANPNYFFNSYQMVGDKYNKPNVDKYHLPAWNKLSIFARQNKVNIVNCSKGSKLKCFIKSDLINEL